MADTTATLGFAVDSSGLKDGQQELDKTVNKAKQVEDQAKKTGDALSNIGGKGGAASLKDASAAADQLAASLVKVGSSAGTTFRVTQAINDVVKGTGVSYDVASASVKRAVDAHKAAEAATRASAVASTTNAAAAAAVGSATAKAADAVREKAAAFRQLNQVMGPSTFFLNQFGGHLGSVLSSTARLTGSIPLLAAALGGTLAFALGKVGDELFRSLKNFEALTGSAGRGKTALEEIQKTASSSGLAAGTLESAVLKAAQGVDLMADKTVIYANSADKAANAQARFREGFGTIGKLMQTLGLTAEQDAKIIDALASSMQKTGGVGADAFQKIIDTSFATATAIAKAFNFDSAEKFRQHLEKLPVSSDAFLAALRRVQPQIEEAYNARPVTTLGQEFEHTKSKFDEFMKTLSSHGGDKIASGFLTTVTEAFKVLSGDLSGAKGPFAGMMEPMAAAKAMLADFAERWRSVFSPGSISDGAKEEVQKTKDAVSSLTAGPYGGMFDFFKNLFSPGTISDGAKKEVSETKAALGSLNDGSLSDSLSGLQEEADSLKFSDKVGEEAKQTKSILSSLADFVSGLSFTSFIKIKDLLPSDKVEEDVTKTKTALSSLNDFSLSGLTEKLNQIFAPGSISGGAATEVSTAKVALLSLGDFSIGNFREKIKQIFFQGSISDGAEAEVATAKTALASLGGFSFTDIVEKLRGLFKPGTISDGAREEAQTTKDVFSSLVDTVNNFSFSRFFDSINDSIAGSGLIKYFQDLGSLFQGGPLTTVQSIFSGISSAIGVVSTGVSQLISAIKALGDTASSVLSSIADGIARVKSALGSAMGGGSSGRGGGGGGESDIQAPFSDSLGGGGGGGGEVIQVAGGGGGGFESFDGGGGFDESGFEGAFATGGSFIVKGLGGTDSKTVSFKATPGERVTIETPAQASAPAISAISQAIKSSPIYAGAFADGGSVDVGGSGGTDSQTVVMQATPGETISVTTPAAQAASQSEDKKLIDGQTEKIVSALDKIKLAVSKDTLLSQAVAAMQAAINKMQPNMAAAAVPTTASPAASTSFMDRLAGGGGTGDAAPGGGGFTSEGFKGLEEKLKKEQADREKRRQEVYGGPQGEAGTPTGSGLVGGQGGPISAGGSKGGGSILQRQPGDTGVVESIPFKTNLGPVPDLFGSRDKSAGTFVGPRAEQLGLFEGPKPQDTIQIAGTGEGGPLGDPRKVMDADWTKFNESLDKTEKNTSEQARGIDDANKSLGDVSRASGETKTEVGRTTAAVDSGGTKTVSAIDASANLMSKVMADVGSNMTSALSSMASQIASAVSQGKSGEAKSIGGGARGGSGSRGGGGSSGGRFGSSGGMSDLGGGGSSFDESGFESGFGDSGSGMWGDSGGGFDESGFTGDTGDSFDFGESSGGFDEEGFAGEFATGGQFKVGGSGAVDKTPISFLATKGETVQIFPPGVTPPSGVNVPGAMLSPSASDGAVKPSVPQQVTTKNVNITVHPGIQAQQFLRSRAQIARAM